MTTNLIVNKLIKSFYKSNSGINEISVIKIGEALSKLT